MTAPRPRLFAALVLAFVLTAAIAGCGGGDTEEDKGPSAAEESAAAVDERIETGRDDCTAWLSDFRSALTELDSRLSVGLLFADYITAVGDVRVAYDAIDREASVDAYCIEKVALPLETALNEYVAAANEWNACQTDLYCNDDEVTPGLQARWATAQTLMADAGTSLSDYQDPDSYVPSAGA